MKLSLLRRFPTRLSGFFIELYTKDGVNRPYIPNLFETRLSSSTGEELEIPFLEEEVKAAVFGIQKDKALGLDGYSMHLYQVIW